MRPARHSGSLLFSDGTRIGSPCTVITQNLSIGRPWPIKGLAGRRISAVRTAIRMRLPRSRPGAGTRRVTLTRTVRPPAIHTAGRGAKANPNGIPGDHLLLVCSPVVWLRGGGRAVAVFPFAPVAAGARSVAGATRIRIRVGLHEFGGCPVLAKQSHHGLQGFSDVPEERLVARTQVMLTRFAVRGRREPVLRAPAVAREPHIAVPAELREGVTLVQPESPLLRQG